MGLFNTILEKLGLKKKEQAADTPKTAAAPAAPAVKKPVVTSMPNLTHVSPSLVPQTNIRMSDVDVVNKLDQLAKANPQKLDWKVSIVDLLKLLDIDSSLAARKELATELGCPAEKMGGDYSEMNMWLHKEVLKKIAANGGNIPKELLD